MAKGGKPRRARPEKTWQDTLRDDLQVMDVGWEEAKSVAGDRKERRPLITQCSNETISVYNQQQLSPVSLRGR